MKKVEKTIENNVVYDGIIMTVNCDDVLSANGLKVKREVVHHNGGVCILAEVDGKIAMVKQFRYAYGEEMYELPAGKLEKGENPVHAAFRPTSSSSSLIAACTGFSPFSNLPAGNSYISSP